MTSGYGSRTSVLPVLAISTLCRGQHVVCVAEEDFFYRCDDCRKHFDVLTFSHLLSLRLPLVIVSRAIDMHFQKSPPPSASDVGRALGCSATPGGSCHNNNERLAFLIVRS